MPRTRTAKLLAAAKRIAPTERRRGGQKCANRLDRFPRVLRGQAGELLAPPTAPLELCLERGMRFPFHVAILAANGSAMTVWWPEVGEPETRLQYVDGGVFKLPINMMFVSTPTGEAARLTLRNNDLAIH